MAFRSLSPRRATLGLLAVLLIAVSSLHLMRTRETLAVEHFRVGPTPVSVFRQAGDPTGPLVVIAHGFAGSRPLMQPFAVTLARNGYLAATFDFLGHGRNRAPLTGSLTEIDGATVALQAELGRVAAAVRERWDAPGPYAVLGHSMASDIVIRHARDDARVAATVAVSMFSPAIEPGSPRNLLIVNGALEAGLNALALEKVAQVAGAESVAPEQTYGDLETGSARRLVLADGVEHVGVLFSPESMEETVRWLDRAFGREAGPPAYVDNRGPWLALLLLAVVTAWRVLAPLLPRLAGPALGAGLRGRSLAWVLIIPTVAVPLALRLLPTDFLPVLVGDYLAVHFLAYGLLTTVLLLWRGRRSQAAPLGPALVPRLVPAALAVLALAFPLGAVLNWQVTSFVPIPERLPLLLAVLVGTLPWFLADEWVTRGETGAWYGYTASKVAFVLSLGLAVALDFERLFFLLIIVPVIVPLFIVFGLLSRWSYRATGHPWAAGLANAVVFAWAIGVTFPLVDG